MNILYLCPRFPYPPAEGDKITIHNHLKFLSRRNKVTLLTLIENEGQLEGLKELYKYCAHIETFKKRSNFALRHFITAVYKTEPFTVIRYYSKNMFRRSKQLIESAQFDIVHAAFYYMGPYVINKHIKIPKTTAVVLDTHLIEYYIYSRYARFVKNPLLKLFIKLESLRIKKYELAIYKRFDRCLAVSDLDKENIIKLSGASNIAVNPHCIDLPPAQPPVSYEEEDNTLLYFGGLRYVANDDAIRFFYESIFPLIKKDIPSVKFVITGKNPSRYVLGLARDPSVRFVGFVPDIRDFLKKIALVVVPLRLGGGIRMKILESWSAAKAVVSTSIGAEGVQISNGSDIIIADTADDFANQTVRLLRDKATREALGSAGFEKVCKVYNSEKLVENLEKIYREILAQKRND